MRLSKLQKCILLLALKKDKPFYTSGQIFFDGWNSPPDVTPAQIKMEYYGFPINRQGTKLLFKRSEVGKARYLNASVAISNAFAHLERKGLAEKRFRGITLTERGWSVAKNL